MRYLFAFVLLCNLAGAQIINPGGGGAVSSLTTTGSSGAATLSGGVLNIPIYTGGGGTPCTTTALSFQYNNAGAFGCVTDWTFDGTHTTSVAAAGILNLNAMTVANLKFPTAFSTGLVRVTTATGALGSAELSGDATTSGSNAVTVVKINGTLLSGLATGIYKNTAGTGVPSIAVGSDLPAAIPIASVGSAGLSGTSPVTINAAGAIGCSTCNVSAAVANPPLDKSGTGLSNPTADATFTYPVSSTTGLTLAGTTPASVASATGTTATTLFNVNGVAGGACTAAACTGGPGSSPTINAGTGGSVAGASGNAVGGAGGNVTLNGAVGANSINSGVNSNGGNVILNPGAAGTGGSGTAGKAGVVSVTGPGAGFIGYQQGAAVTTANTQVPANTIIEQAPTSVTAYTLTKPGVGPVNNFSVKSISNTGTESFAKTQQTVMLTTQYTNSTTGFTNITGTNSLAFALEANTTYQGTCTLYYQAASTGGLNIEFTGPASPTFVTYSLVDPGTATTFATVSVATAYSTSLGAAVGTATTNFPATITFGLSNGANAGTLQMLAKSSAAAQLQIQTGSYCVMQ